VLNTHNKQEEFLRNDAQRNSQTRISPGMHLDSWIIAKSLIEDLWDSHLSHGAETARLALPSTENL
jgi:hypothetical protein